MLSQQAPEAEAGATASLAHAAAADDGMAPNAAMAPLTAACLGDAQAVAAWLDEGGGVDARYELKDMTPELKGMTLLMGAAAGGHEAVVRMLLRRGASVNLRQSFGGTALMAAAEQGHPSIVQVLLDAKADASLKDLGGRTALMLAELQTHTTTAQLLQQHAERLKVKAEARVAASAAQEGLPDSVLLAAGRGEAQAVAAWLDEGGCLDARCAEHYDSTLLMTAAAGGHEAMVRMMLQRGASVNLQTSVGGTALMGAAISGHTTIMQALLDAKADASPQTEDGNTALMVAELHKHTAAAQLLRQHAERQAAEAEARAAAAATHVEAAAPTPNLSGRRVRIFGLKGRPELNGRCGVAGRFDAAKGRYEVAVEREAEAVLLKPANLQEICANPNPNPIPKPSLSCPLTLSRTLSRTLIRTLVRLRKGCLLACLTQH